MLATSQKYKDYITAPNREFEARAIIDGVIYGSDKVVEFAVEDMITGADELTIGTVIPTKLSIQLKTTDVVPSNAKIVPEIRLNGSQGYTEWISMGEFYIDSRKYQNGVWSFECVDKLITTEQPYISSLTYPVAMGSVFSEILDILGIESDVTINSAFQIPYKDETISIREMLSCIASAHGSNVKLSREGELIFIPLSPTLTPVATIMTSNYIRAEQTNPQKAYTKLQVVHNSEGEILERGTGSEDNTLKFENRFMFIEQNQFDNAFSVIDGFSYTPFNMAWLGRPDLDVGDMVKIVLLDETEITSIVAVNKISFKGGVLQQSSAPSKSEQQSEFRFQGSLSKQMAQRLVKDQVYNGVSFGPEYGLKVERTDKKARVLANATEGIKIQKGDGAGNYTDVIFLDAEGNGNFTGRVTASSFEGGSIAITRDDNKARVLIDGTDGIKIQKGDGIGATWTDVMYVDAEGNANFTGIITGGIIRTAAEGARIQISDNQIRHYNGSERLQGLCTNTEAKRYGDVEIYDGGELIFRIYVDIGSGVWLRQENEKPLVIGDYGEDTYCRGNWNGMIQCLTQANINEKIANGDALDTQLFIATDINFDIGDDLAPISAITVEAINETRTEVNKIKDILKFLTGTGDENVI